MFDKDAEINHDLVVKKLREIMAARGKKRTNRKEQIELLTELFNIAQEHELGKIVNQLLIYFVKWFDVSKLLESTQSGVC